MAPTNKVESALFMCMFIALVQWLRLHRECVLLYYYYYYKELQIFLCFFTNIRQKWCNASLCFSSTCWCFEIGEICLVIIDILQHVSLSFTQMLISTVTTQKSNTLTLSLKTPHTQRQRWWQSCAMWVNLSIILMGRPMVTSVVFSPSLCKNTSA